MATNEFALVPVSPTEAALVELPHPNDVPLADRDEWLAALDVDALAAAPRVPLPPPTEES